MTARPVVDLDAVRERREIFKASHAHDGGFACCTAHACAEDVPPLIAEIERLREELGDPCPHGSYRNCGPCSFDRVFGESGGSR